MYLTSQSYTGQKIQDVYPHLRGFIDQELKAQNIDEIDAVSDVVFLACLMGMLYL
jgi:N-acetyl-gamma-glutamyl-phosphate reductase